MGLTGLAIFKELPKKNCGECGSAGRPHTDFDDALIRHAEFLQEENQNHHLDGRGRFYRLGRFCGESSVRRGKPRCGTNLWKGRSFP